MKGPGTRVYHFGQAGDVPVTGNWDGSGKTRIGIYRPSTGEWLLDYNGSGALDAGDRTSHFGGQAGDVPVTGDWDGSGKTKIGIYRPSTGEWRPTITAMAYSRPRRIGDINSAVRWETGRWWGIGPGRV